MPRHYIARIDIEAETPMKIGHGKGDFLQDSPVRKDFNGFPTIPGTSIAGVLRRLFPGETDSLFGYRNAKDPRAEGSRLIVSNALLLDETGRVYETLLANKSPFLCAYDALPLRDHVALDGRGVARKNHKFDEEVVFRGSRFRFTLELTGDAKSDTAWRRLLETLHDPMLRFGGGSTKGFGRFRVVSLEQNSFDDEGYAAFSSSLNAVFSSKPVTIDASGSRKAVRYMLNLHPDDFFHFGSGYGDDSADRIPVSEKMVSWEGERGAFTEAALLIPASSVKGAISHRTAFHYNALKGRTIENQDGRCGNENEAVLALFGAAKGEAGGQKGRVLIGDLHRPRTVPEKVFDHVKIDRFTGGAYDGALFDEKVSAERGELTMELTVGEEAFTDPKVREAFEKSLDDITTGMLPLGGMSMKGHGIFTGTWSRQ